MNWMQLERVNKQLYEKIVYSISLGYLPWCPVHMYSPVCRPLVILLLVNLLALQSKEILLSDHATMLMMNSQLNSRWLVDLLFLLSLVLVLLSLCSGYKYCFGRDKLHRTYSYWNSILRTLMNDTVNYNRFLLLRWRFLASLRILRTLMIQWMFCCSGVFLHRYEFRKIFFAVNELGRWVWIELACRGCGNISLILLLVNCGFLRVLKRFNLYV